MSTRSGRSHALHDFLFAEDRQMDERRERLLDDWGFRRTAPIRPWDIDPDGRFFMIRRSTQYDLRKAMEAFYRDRIRLIQKEILRLAD